MFMNCFTGEKQSVEVGDCSTLNSYCEYIYMVIINPREKRCFPCTLKFDCQFIKCVDWYQYSLPKIWSVNNKVLLSNFLMLIIPGKLGWECFIR